MSFRYASPPKLKLDFSGIRFWKALGRSQRRGYLSWPWPTGSILPILLVITACSSISPSRLAEVPNGQSAAQSSRKAEADFAEKVAWQMEREPAHYGQFSQTFIRIFNSDDMNEIIGVSAPALIEDMGEEKIVGFLKFMKENNGEIVSLRFKYFDTRNQVKRTHELAGYLMGFENGSLWDLRVGLDDQQRLSRYIITDNNFNEDLPLIHARSALQLPFEKDQQWYVLWGGETEAENYHVVSRAQKNAFDFLIRNPWSKKSYQTDGKTNEDYFAFGKPILSPVAGEVVTVIDGVPDNEPGTMNPRQLTGNTIVVRTDVGEYVLMAHFQNGSISVKEGERVVSGSFLGRCGNSGNSSEPPLHLHVMDAPDLRYATGLKAHFDGVTIDGVSTAENYTPKRGDVLSRN